MVKKLTELVEKITDKVPPKGNLKNTFINYHKILRETSGPDRSKAGLS